MYLNQSNEIHVYFVHRHATQQHGISEQHYVGGPIASTSRAPTPEFPNQLEETLVEKKIKQEALELLVDEKMTVDGPDSVLHQETMTKRENPQVSYNAVEHVKVYC